MKRARVPALVLLAAALLAGRLPPQEPADLLLFNGRVVTVDSAFSVRSAVAVRGGRIVAVGGDELARRFRAARTVDLRGRAVLPGFIDAHVHLLPPARRSVDLSGARSMAELRERIRGKARELGPGEWITGTWSTGWAEDDLAERRPPLRADLDAAAPENPVYVPRLGGHSYAANSLALRLAGVGRDTPEPRGGVIERDAAGEPTGIFREGPAIGLVFRGMRDVPGPSPEEARLNAVRFLNGLLAHGITSIVEASWTTSGFRHWEAAYAEHGDSLPRASVQVTAEILDDGETDAVIRELREFGRKTGDGDERLRVGALKVFVDGGWSGAAAATLRPYAGRPGWHGRVRVPEPELYALVRAAHDMGWQMGFHTAGDSAVKLAVDVFGRVLDESPRPDHRHYLTHFGLLPPDATLRAMARRGIGVVQQPNFLRTNEGLFRAFLGPERLERAIPLRTPLRHGIHLALGSDNLPVGPLAGIHAAVTRRGKSGAPYAAGERLTVAEAIRAYTRDAAWVTGEERVKGSVEPGKLADLVVLSEDPLAVDPERIPELRVEMTILGGRVVHERPRAR